MTQPVVPRIRWRIPAPGPDESLESILARAAAFLERRRDDVWHELIDGLPPCEPHDPSTPALLRLAQALRIPARSLISHRLAPQENLLLPQARRAFCPACWMEDDALGRPRGFRRSWAAVFALRCLQHNVPLVACASIHQSLALPAIQLPAMAANASLRNHDAALLQSVHTLAETIHASLAHGAAWPTGWKGSAAAARTQVMRACLNAGCEPDFVPCSHLMPSPELARFIHPPSTRHAPSRGDPWTAFRLIADPGVRRAALWLVAIQLGLVPEVGRLDLFPHPDDGLQYLRRRSRAKASMRRREHVNAAA